MKNFYPNFVFRSAYDIKIDFLKKKMIKAIIFDIDNTLVPFQTERPDEKVISFIKGILDSGIKVAILSNNNQQRVDVFCEPLGIYSIARASKPMGRSYKRVLIEFGCQPHEVLVVGDQIFTDIYGGMRQGLLSALVPPICRDTAWFIKLKRVFEKGLLKHGVKKGYITVKNYNTFYGIGGE